MANIIGLTGGIASGKSTVSSMLKSKGFTIIDADIAARKVVEKGEQAYTKIIEAFGRTILHENGSIDRKKLGEIVFNDEKKRQLLNGIIHPEIRACMLREKEDAVKKGKQTVILDIPLLFENKLEWMVNRTILVYVDDHIQLERLMLRNHFSEQEAKSRIQAQMPLIKKRALADKVINNNGSMTNALKQLEQIIHEWNLKP
ncbi:dephospho-CoA kinase [Heyndrickxia ginsengihumi]|uniref:dephospho-CoA kinase n=1 Tax=Heyndrickxia ginsengihumi TaxID=363870 RepID=UPI003D1E4252